MVSHPLNANPYLGSLLNYRAKLRLQEVTVENRTFVQLHCSFETEHKVSTLSSVKIPPREASGAESRFANLFCMPDCHLNPQGHCC